MEKEKEGGANNTGGKGRAIAPPAPTPAGRGRAASDKAPLSRNAVMLKAQVDYAREAERWADMEPAPEIEAPAPFAVQGMDKPLREAARRIGALHQLATCGGMASVDLMGSGGGGGAVPSSPQERVAWAIGLLRRVVVAAGMEGDGPARRPRRVRLDARGAGPAVVELLAAVCAHDMRLRGFIKAQGLKPNGDRQRACEAALEAALERAAEVLGCQC